MEKQLNTNQNLVPLSWIGQTQDSTQSVVNSTSSVAIQNENSRENVFFDAQGKFAAGHPGLPGAGRPKTRLISEALKQALADGKADELKETLLGLATTAKDSVKLAAIQEITDRTEGKAVQNIRHAGVFMVMAPSAEALAKLDSWAGDDE